MISEEDKQSLQKITRNDNYLPIIINVQEQSVKIKKLKFLVMKCSNASGLFDVIRKRIGLTPEKAMFLFIKNTLVNNSKTVGEIYEEYGDKENKVLVFCLKLENTFGNN